MSAARQQRQQQQQTTRLSNLLKNYLVPEGEGLAFALIHMGESEDPQVCLQLRDIFPPASFRCQETVKLWRRYVS
jgi:hypothetical protein